MPVLSMPSPHDISGYHVPGRLGNICGQCFILARYLILLKRFAKMTLISGGLGAMLVTPMATPAATVTFSAPLPANAES